MKLHQFVEKSMKAFPHTIAGETHLTTGQALMSKLKFRRFSAYALNIACAAFMLSVLVFLVVLAILRLMSLTLNEYEDPPITLYANVQ